MLKQANNAVHQTVNDEPGFPPINRGYNSVFRPNHLSLGLVVPLETYSQGPVPTMARHLERIQLAEQLGFAAVWLRDVPFNVPSFGDAGQMYDPFVYLGLLAGQTNRIALGVASVVLPLRHPAHVAIYWAWPRVTGPTNTRHSISPLPSGARVFAPVLTISSACGKTRRRSRIPTAAHKAGWTCCPNRQPADCHC